MKKLSLRMRLTLITALIIVFACGAITLISMYNASESFIEPLQAITLNATMPIDTASTEYEIIPAAVSTEAEIAMKSNYGVYLSSVNDAVMLGTSVYNLNSIVLMLIVIGVGTLLVYVIAGIALKPVKKLSEQISNMDEKDLSIRITEFVASDELNTLANSFNNMITKLESAFIREKRFSADAAHELRTPLSVIKTNIDVLSQTPDAQEYEETINVIDKQNNRMIALVKELLSMSTEYSLAETAMADTMLNEILGELSSAAKEKNINISKNIQPCKVRANITMLKHGFSNIVENAIKYNCEGGNIDVVLTQNEKNCIVRICDTGIGIDESNAKHIFEPFYRIDKSRSREIGGAGLGLSIAKEIFDKHNGSIKYIKNNPCGSIFEIIIPKL